MRLRRAILPLAGLSLLVPSMVSCGNEDTHGDSQLAAAVRAAPDIAIREGTARTYASIQTDVEGKSVNTEASGEVDFSQRAIYQHISDGDGLDAEQAIIDGLFYQRGFTSEEWSVRAFEEANLRAAFNHDSAFDSDSLDQLNQLDDVDDVREVGPETVRGVQTNHVRGTIDLATQLEKIPDDSDESTMFKDFMKRVLTEERMAVDVWLDGQGRAVKISMSLTYNTENLAKGKTHSVFKGVGNSTLTMTFEYFDWGTPLNIEPPI